MKIETRTAAVAAALCGFASLPAGCTGEERLEDVEVRVDASPLERPTAPVVSSYSDVLNEVRPAVVSVFSRRIVTAEDLPDHPLLEQFFGSRSHRESPETVQSGLGSGVIVSPQGYVLTNNHVVDGADEIAILLEDGRELEAEVVGTDPRTDVAVLRVTTSEELPSAVLADSDAVAVGDVVFALGNALGIGNAVTTGIISARGRTGIGILGEDGYEDFLQTDASMNIGNSGGPLVDAQGRVIGINTAIASPGGGNVGIGFAIPINMARNVMENLIRHGEVPRGYLGLVLQDLTRELAEEFGVERTGVLVANVLEGSPAEGAGIRQGDVVTELNDEPVESSGLLRLRVGQMAPEAPVTVTLSRDGRRMEVPVVLGRLEEIEPQEDARGSLNENELLPGIGVSELTPRLRDQLDVEEEISGLVVTEADPASPYAGDFPEGALILQVNRQPVAEVEAARAMIRDGRNLFLLLVDGTFRYVTVRVEEF